MALSLSFGLWQLIRVFLDFLIMHSHTIADHAAMMNLHFTAACITVPIAVISIVKMNARVVAGNPATSKNLLIAFDGFFGLGYLLAYYEFVKTILTFLLSNSVT